MEPLPQALSCSVPVPGMPRDAEEEEEQSYAAFSRADPNFPHLQHIWAAVSQGFKEQLNLSVGGHGRNNPVRQL